MSDQGQELHPRLRRAHAELRSANPYRDAIRMVDAGHFAAAIPPTHRSPVKGFVETALEHFHDLGFQHGIAGAMGGVDAGWQTLETTEAAAAKLRFESLLNRLSDEFRRIHREVETRWKQTPATEPRKQLLFKEMNEKRRDLSKVLALDKTTFVAKMLQLLRESFEIGYALGASINTSNDRKRRLGLPVEDITIPIRLFVDPGEFESVEADPHASFAYETKPRPATGPGQFH